MRLTLGWAISASTILRGVLGRVGDEVDGALRQARLAEALRRSARGCAGSSPSALNTTVLPQASGIATERTPRMIGAFHGAIDRITPTGWRIAMASRARPVGGDHLAGDLRRHRRRLADHVGGEPDIEMGPVRRAAGLGDHRGGEVVDLRLEDVGGLEEELPPLDRRQSPTTPGRRRRRHRRRAARRRSRRRRRGSRPRRSSGRAGRRCASRRRRRRDRR